MTPPDGGEGLGPGIAQAWQKNGCCKALLGDKWPVVGQSKSNLHYIGVTWSFTSKQR